MAASLQQAGIIVLKYLDMITVAVPPALAATLAVATAAAVSRLAKSGIFVSSSQHINFAGLVDFVAFDKTGTLTLSGLEFVGVAEAVEGKFAAGGLQADMGALAEQHIQVWTACDIADKFEKVEYLINSGVHAVTLVATNHLFVGMLLWYAPSAVCVQLQHCLASIGRQLRCSVSLCAAGHHGNMPRP